MRLEDFSDSCRGLKGDDISHIISWGHRGCMAVWALLAWFITLSAISFSDGWLIGQAWNSSLLSIDVCVCAQYIIWAFRVDHFSTLHSPTANQACVPHSLMICMSDCCMTNQHIPRAVPDLSGLFRLPEMHHSFHQTSAKSLNHPARGSSSNTLHQRYKAQTDGLMKVLPTYKYLINVSRKSWNCHEQSPSD